MGGFSGMRSFEGSVSTLLSSITLRPIPARRPVKPMRASRPECPDQIQLNTCERV